MQEQPCFMGSLPKGKQLKVVFFSPELILSSSTSYIMVSSWIFMAIAIARTCPVKKFGILLLAGDIFYLQQH